MTISTEDIQRMYKTHGLRLVRLKVPGGDIYTSRFGDQHGRILEHFINSNGERDLRPVGLYRMDEVA